MTPLVEILRHLVAMNSVNPTLAGGPGEAQLARWIVAWLRERGVESVLQEVAPRRPNVIAHIAGRGEAPPLLLNAHLDTVGVEGMEKPFLLWADGDRLRGRGSYDMKGSIAIMLSLAEIFIQSPPPGDLWLTLSVDEEDRSLGSEMLIQEWLPTLTTPPAAALVLEPTEEGIGIAHKGFGWYEMQVRGRAAHGSRPEEGIDAIAPLSAALGTLLELERTFSAGECHPLLGRPSLHASTIQGGSGWSIYPASATLRWERRTLPGESEAALEAELGRVIAAAAGVNESTVEGHCAFGRAPLGTPPDSALVRLVQSVHPDGELVGLSFWTDGALFSGAGLPTVIYGPIGHGAHAVDEWVSAASLRRVREVVRQVIERASNLA